MCIHISMVTSATGAFKYQRDMEQSECKMLSIGLVSYLAKGR
jgi:hypothetical protein